MRRIEMRCYVQAAAAAAAAQCAYELGQRVDAERADEQLRLAEQVDVRPAAALALVDELPGVPQHRLHGAQAPVIVLLWRQELRGEGSEKSGGQARCDGEAGQGA